MLRSAIIAIALGTILASGAGSANATAFTDVDLRFSLFSLADPSCTGCIAELIPSDTGTGTSLDIDTIAIATPGMDVDVQNIQNFSLHLVNPADALGPFFGVDLRVLYDFSITVTNGLLDSGSYNYVLSPAPDINMCSYPSGGGPMPGFSPPTPVPGPGSYCVVHDFNDFGFSSGGPGTDLTEDFTVFVDARAASLLPEPSSMGLLALALFFLASLHGRRRNERHE